jgi:hypothetical protein
VSQGLARTKGFKGTLSKDNNTIVLKNEDQDVTYMFEYDDRDMFYKCKMIKDRENSGSIYNTSQLKDYFSKEDFKEKASCLQQDFIKSLEPRHDSTNGKDYLPTKSNDGVLSYGGADVKNNIMKAINYHSVLQNTTTDRHSLTLEQQGRAEKALALHVSLHHPSDKALMAMLSSPSMINCDISVQDMINARAIHGPCSACLEGKSFPNTNTNPTHDPQDSPNEAGHTLHVDIAYIGGKPYLLAVCGYSGRGADVKNNIMKAINYHSVLQNTTTDRHSLTLEQQGRAEKALALHVSLHHPSDKALMAMLSSPSIYQCKT